MFHLDFKINAQVVPQKLSAIFLPDSFFYALLDDKNQIVHHQYFSHIKYSQEASIERIMDSLSDFLGINQIYITVMNDYSFQSTVQDDNILKILPSTQHKVNMLEVIPGQDIFNYFQLNPAQENLLNLITVNKSPKIRDFVSILSSYHTAHSGAVLHIHLENNRVFIYAQSNLKLVFYKVFEYGEKEDILYFALTAQSLFKEEVYHTFASGSIDAHSPVFNLLEKYTQNLKLVQDNIYTVAKEGYKKTQFHHYFVHISSVLCE